MPGKSIDINLRRQFTHLQAVHEWSGSRFVLSLDMEKAFDSVDWEWLLCWVGWNSGLGS